MKQTDQSLFKKLCLMLVAFFMVTAAWAQQSITGTVVDLAGEPLPGVAVVVQGTTNGTATNIDGNFSIEAAGDATLQFSFVGMKTLLEKVEGRSIVNVTLETDAIGIEEIVTVGYGVQKKATLTGSVGNVKAEEMIQRPVANTTELLQGKVSGLYTRQQTGLPGADGTTLNIRGYGSNPLVLIDGIQGSLAHIDPNDIESVSVLKDAAAAVYGARAGNGVILVTTKRGSNKPSSITYHGNVSFTQPTFLPDIVEARKWAELLNESGLNPDDYSPGHIHYDPESKRLINTLDDSDYYGYDWDEELYRDWTPQQQHNISATGGTNKIKYFVSLGFTDQASNFTSGDYNYNRYNIRSNIDAEITDNLSISVDFSYRKRRIDKANFDVSSMYNSLQTAKPVYPITHEADPNRAASSGFLQRSPYHQTFKDFSGFQDNRNNNLQGALELKYKVPFVEGLVAKARLNYEEGYTWNKSVTQPFDVWEYNPVFAADGTDPWVKWGTQNANRIKVYSSKSNELLPQLSLNYNKALGDHNLKAVLVAESWSYKWTSLQGNRKDLLSFEAPYLIYASEEGKDNGENLKTDGKVGISERARASFIGRINYDYQGKYMLEVAMRADASGEYPPSGRWGYFPSVSAGWRISEEAFIKDNFSAVDNLKLRGSYGILGYDAVSSFDYLTGYAISPTDFYVFGSAPAPVISSAGLANPNITWETMKMSNLGLDGTFWNGLLGFEIDVFYRLREDILVQPTEQVPGTFGATMPRTNLNKRDNRGLEFALTHKNKVGEVNYYISPMFAWTRGKFVEVDENSTPPSTLTTEEDIERWKYRNIKEGNWDDRVWGYVTEGFFMNQEQIDNHPINQNQAEVANDDIKVGDLIYKDLNGDNYIDWRDQAVIGKSGLPKTMYSLDMGADYKGFSLKMLWQGGANYVVTVSGSAAAGFSNESIPLAQHFDYRAIVAQDEAGNDYISNPNVFKLPPVNENGRTANNGKASDFWTYEAAYLRLKNINLSYTLPKSLIDKAGFKNCVVYFSASNLFAISNLDIWKDSFDPEIPGANNRDYPPVKTMTFGLRLTL